MLLLLLLLLVLLRSMCLFLQNQNFQALTAKLLTDMHGSSRAANATLGTISSRLSQHSEALEASQQQLGKLAQLQQRVHEEVALGVAAVQQVAGQTQQLTTDMTKSLDLAVRGRWEIGTRMDSCITHVTCRS